MAFQLSSVCSMEQEGGKLRFPFTLETLKGSHIHIPDLHRADKGLSSPIGHNLEVGCPSGVQVGPPLSTY